MPNSSRRVVVTGSPRAAFFATKLVSAHLGAEPLLYRLSDPSMPDPGFDLALVVLCGCMDSLAEHNQMDRLREVLQFWYDSGVEMNRVVFRPTGSDDYRYAIPAELGIPDECFTTPGMDSEPWLARAKALLDLRG